MIDQALVKRQSMVGKGKNESTPKKASCVIRWKRRGDDLFGSQGVVVDRLVVPQLSETIYIKKKYYPQLSNLK